MAQAFVKRVTLMAIPRFSFSENSRQLIHRHSDYLTLHSDFYQRTSRHGLTHMIEVGCGYLSKEYDEFCILIRKLNDEVPVRLLSFGDVIGETCRLEDIILSGTKVHM